VSEAAHALANQVIAMAGGSKPWFLASQSRKQAYQQLQTNAAGAKAQVARLDALAPSVASASGAELDRAIGEATSVKQSLADLYASSTAAAQAAK
jgi:hypothetical protein